MKIARIRNRVMGILYQNVLKPTFFIFDAEKMHKLFVLVGATLGSNVVTRKATSLMFNYSNKTLEQKIKGIRFRNPVGLAAGFDKNGELTKILPDVGFGFEVVGSITANACKGNEGIRLKRITKRNSLWVNLGLNNRGVDNLIKRYRGKKFEFPVGISVAKTNSKETVSMHGGINDYIYSLKALNKNNIGDFYVINISCPNAFGGQPFSNPLFYSGLMKEVVKLKIKKPIFIKMSPDLTNKNIDQIMKISEKSGISGFVCSNLTKKNTGFKTGGLSGKAVEENSNRMISYIYQKGKGRFVIMGVGGIFSARDAYQKIKSGASLVKLVTGMIYKGPNLVSDINIGLEEMLHADGYKNLSEAVGKGNIYK